MHMCLSSRIQPVTCKTLLLSVSDTLISSGFVTAKMAEGNSSKATLARCAPP